MTLSVEQASPATLTELESWRYEPPYDFYNGNGQPVRHPERYFEARNDDGQLIGFFYFEWKDDALEYGLGLRPDLTGRGHGLEFVRAGLGFARERFRPVRVILTVATFNERARLVYERAGFRATGRQVRRFARWGDVEFLEMELGR